MKDIYKLAIKLKIPIILQEEWAESIKLMAEAEKLELKGIKLYGQSNKFESIEVMHESDRLNDKANDAYRNAVKKEFGKTVRINWETGEVLFPWKANP